MTTINNQNDFLEALRNNPQWRDAVRAQILGEDLLQLPAKFDAFAQEQSQRLENVENLAQEQGKRLENVENLAQEQGKRLENVENLAQEQGKRLENVENLAQEQGKRLENLENLAQEQNQRLENLENLAQGQNQRLENVENLAQEQNTRTTNLEERVGRIEGDTGALKGNFARTRTIQDAQDITSDMGLEFVRTLSARDLSHMAGNSLPRDIHRSFRNADLVIEATDGTDTRYIAMEISFTADRRDYDRAIRNAGIITRFTGKAAQAAIASVRNDRDAAEAVESGAVYWHPLEDRTPSPE